MLQHLDWQVAFFARAFLLLDKDAELFVEYAQCVRIAQLLAVLTRLRGHCRP